MLEDLAEAMGDESGPLDGIFLDLHGAMVAAHHEDGEGELLRRIRALVGDGLPIVTSLDFHTNMTEAMVRHASAMVGYKTYPHIDMAATGSRAAQLLDRLIREKRPLYKAFRQANFLIPLVWQCTLAEPTKGVFDLMEEIERGGAQGGLTHNQGIVSITHTPGFPPADIGECGPALVVYGRDQEAADAAADRILAAINAKEAEFAGRLYTADEAAQEAIRLSRTATKPIVLAEHSRIIQALVERPTTVGLLLRLIAHKANGAVIGVIVDPEAAAAPCSGRGAVLPGEDRRQGRIRRRDAGRGKMAESFAPRVAILSALARCSAAPVSCRPVRAVSPMRIAGSRWCSPPSASRRSIERCRHVGIEPSAVPILALGNRPCIFRADFPSRSPRRCCACCRRARMSATRSRCRTSVFVPVSACGR